MALNPNIIANSMSNITAGMPDASNLMAQRVQGAENIYKIETARQAAAEEEAAALKKEQEDALVKAMLPAFAHGFNNPTDFDGMLALVPPEQRPNVAPLVDQMRGMTPEQVVSALTGSLVTSDVGRSFLENQARQRTYQVQLQQAETAAAREAREAAAAGQPEPMSAYQQAQQDLAERKFAAEQELASAGQPKPMSAYEEAQIGLREREVGLREEEAAAKAAAPDGMDPKTKVKFEQAYPKSASALRTAVTGMDNTLTALEKLINDPGLELISGTVGAYTPNLNKDAKRAQALFDQIKAGAGLAALVELKQASPSGGALGNVSNQEGNTLRDSRGAFLQMQEYEDLRNALIDYYNVLERSKANIIGAFDDTYAYRGEGAAESILQAAQEQFEKIEEQTEQKFKSGLPPGVTVKKRTAP